MGPRAARVQRGPHRGSRPSTRAGGGEPAEPRDGVPIIPTDRNDAIIDVGGRDVSLTNLQKPFWPELGITKGGLIQYYADVASFLLPHVRGRAMVMKRYPNGAAGPFFFMKRTPSPRPDWIETCSIEHGSGSLIAFPMVQDLATLLWLINLGCIDLNPWYSRCDDVDRPDFLHFDLDPGPQATFPMVLESALVVRQALDVLHLTSYPKTTGSRGVHVYVPIKRGPAQKQVWAFAKALAFELAARNPSLVTAEYRIARRPKDRVLVDYNQNAWGRTLASVYSVRPTPQAAVSAPVTWQEVARGFAIEDFTMRTMGVRLARTGDLWKPLDDARGRCDLEKLLSLAK